MGKTTKRNILISAYACEPLKGSEQGVGWNWVLQLAKNNKLYVITRSNNQEAIESQLPRHLAQNISFHYHDTIPFVRRFKKKSKGLYFYYFFWQIGIITLIRKLIKAHKFDYSVHLTFGSIWMPTFLPFFNVPFIWGPVGGGEGIPKSFLSALPLNQRLLQRFRYTFKYINYFNPFFLYTCFRANSIISRTYSTLYYFPSVFHPKTKVFLETAIDTEVFKFCNKFENKPKVIKLIIVSRLVPFKNIITAIRSLIYLQNKIDFKLTIVGSGSDFKRLQREIERLNLLSKVYLERELNRDEVITRYSDSDICLFPSLREGGSWALMEAMAVGLPVICLKWSGMEIITDDASAIRLPVTNPEQMSRDIAKAICKLADDHDLRLKMGSAGRSRIMNIFNWDSKGEFMEMLFDELDEKCN